MRITAIITGGGTGRRFDDALPKQFHTLPRRKTEEPVIIWSARQFDACSLIHDIVMSVPYEFLQQTKRFLRRFKIRKVISVVPGGQTRRDSVRNALWSLSQKPPDAVLIHDAVRPFADDELITRVIERLARFSVVVPVIEPRDTIRRKGKRLILGRLEDRNNLLMIQTPQAFRWKVISQILPTWNQNTTATDDASIAIEHGFKVGYVEGSPNNFKITSKDDLILAQSYARTLIGKKK
jgi:2-C-methyl-D-erythritol 4-phosphate cytidylyltransferase